MTHRASKDRAAVLAVLCALGLAACGGGQAPPETRATPQPAAGQVAPAPAPGAVLDHAAARLLEQASFGPTPAAVAEVKRSGYSSWIGQQLALPPSQIDGSYVVAFDDTNPRTSRPYWAFFKRRFYDLANGAPDQLRLRVTWALSNFIVVSQAKVQPYGIVTYFNLLQQHAFGNFLDLMRAVSLNAGMGVYLDNNQNRKSGSCDGCDVNENFARELMQLFMLGVVQLRPDGSVVRDAAGKPLETYTQDDVQALARALTGWELVWEPGLPSSNWANYGKLMVAGWRDDHDGDAKTLLGRTISAGGNEEQDLDAALRIVFEHPNVGPFVVTRLIQHLVTSEPNPAYVRRVVGVFNDNGQRVRGDIGAVVRAILLDPEARRADDPSTPTHALGKIREPVLHLTGLQRGLGCTRAIIVPNDSYMAWGAWGQQPFNPASVFSFFSPLHRAPQSLVLAPEQKLLTAREFADRLGGLAWVAFEAPGNLTAAGCRFDEFVAALQRSEADFVQLVGARFFRGALPPTLRAAAQNLLRSHLDWATPEQKVAFTLQFLLTAPDYGVVR